jgi:putative NADH-flavin reductase
MAAKKLVIFGATGGTGRQSVTQAVQQGHQVTAFVRDPQKLQIGADRLGVVTGDVTAGVDTVAQTVSGQDVAISALGRGNSLKSEDLIARSMRTIVPAMERHGVRRLIVVSAFGVGETRRDATLLQRIFFRLLLRDLYADKAAAEEYLRGSFLDWTLVKPTRLTDGPLTGTYRVGERLDMRRQPNISRADVAHFVLTQLADVTYSRKSVTISA